MSLPLRGVVDHARACGRDASAAEAIASHLPRLAVPEADWGRLDFSAGLNARWTAALDNQSAQVERLRERLSGARDRLLRVTADFAEVDAETARNIRDVMNGEAITEDGDPGAHVSSEDIPAPPVTTDRDSPGGEELLTCRTEHLPTLKRAEQLLRDAGRLDFTAPTEYLRQLTGVRPGVVGGRADALSTLSSQVDHMRQELAADSARLSALWEGETAEEVGARIGGIVGQLRRAAAELEWLSGEAEELWRLLDGLLHGVADAVWGQLDTVGASRIARIDAAVALVEDARGYASDASDRAALWGSLSHDDIDDAVHVLYKRVWYLADAMGDLVSEVGRDAVARIDDEHHGESHL